jgi:hypothetical protein
MGSDLAQWQRGFSDFVANLAANLSGDVPLQNFFDIFFGDGADDLFCDRAILKHKQRGNPADVELAGEIHILVDIHLDDFEFARVLRGELRYRRGQCAAGAAPLRPEIDHDRLGLACFDYFRLKIAVTNARDIFSHLNPFVG